MTPAKANWLSPDDLPWTCLFGAWLISLVATLGAIFLGEIIGMQPCVLCWYQRIAMFPIALVLARALLPLDLSGGVRYALPLAWTGVVIAGYHNLLYFELIPARLAPCSQGVSCTDGQLIVAGFVPIPLLSLLAFLAIVVLLHLCARRNLK